MITERLIFIRWCTVINNCGRTLRCYPESQIVSGDETSTAPLCVRHRKEVCNARLGVDI
jgi:hypothetical protein